MKEKFFNCINIIFIFNDLVDSIIYTSLLHKVKFNVCNLVNSHILDK